MTALPHSLPDAASALLRAVQAERDADATVDALAAESSDEQCIATVAALYRAQATLMQAVLDLADVCDALDHVSRSNLHAIFGPQIKLVTKHGADDVALTSTSNYSFVYIKDARELAAYMVMRHDDCIYVATGKVGTHRVNGRRSYEYRCVDASRDARVWRDVTGEVYDD